MKKIILTLFVSFSFLSVWAQIPVNRSPSSITSVDARLQVSMNFGIPRYDDTTAANLALGLDSVAAMIYSRVDSAIYYRKPRTAGAGKMWTKVTGAGSAAYLASNGITLSVSTFKLGGYLTENTTIKGAANLYDFLVDSADATGITNATSITFTTRSGASGGTGGNAGEINLTGGNGGTGVTQGGNGAVAIIQGGNAGAGTTNGVAGYVKIAGGSAPATGNSAGGSIFVTPGAGVGSGLDGTIYLGVSPSATIRGNTVLGATSDDGENILQITGTVALNSYADPTGDSVLAVNSAGKLVNRRAGSTVQFGKIEFVADANSATYQNDSLIDREILGIWIEGSVIGSTVRSTSTYYSFDDATGTITFHNGFIAEEDNVLIYFGNVSLTAGVGVLNTFTPLALSGLLGWWDFTNDTTLTLSSGRIAQANDLSGNGNHVAQATFANMPSYTSTDGGSADFPSSRLTNLDKTLGAAVNGNYTLYVLIRKKSSESFINSGEIFITNNVTASNGIIEKQSTWGDGLWSGYDGTNSTNAVVFRSDNYELFRASIMQGNAVQFHVNDECPSRTFYEGAEPGALPNITMYHFGTRVGLATDFSIKEAIAVADDANVDTDKAVWTYMRAKHGLVSKQYVNMMGDSHIFGSQSGSGGTTGSPAWLVLMNSLGFRTYNNGLTGSKVYDPAATSDPEDFHNVVDTWIANGNPATGWHVIMYGTNDLAADIAQPAWKANYKAAIQKIIDAGYPRQQIIICSPPYTTNPAYDDNVNDAAVIAEDIADEMGLRFADVRQAMIDAGLDCYTVVGGDTIHGNDAIHAVISSTIEAQIY